MHAHSKSVNLGHFLSERLVLPIFRSYIMPNKTYEQITNIARIAKLPLLKVSIVENIFCWKVGRRRGRKEERKKRSEEVRTKRRKEVRKVEVDEVVKVVKVVEVVEVVGVVGVVAVVGFVGVVGVVGVVKVR